MLTIYTIGLIIYPIIMMRSPSYRETAKRKMYLWVFVEAVLWPLVAIGAIPAICIRFAKGPRK